jgi:cold shock CspA family protein
MQQGIVRRIHEAGFCFIEPDDDSAGDIFAHFNDFSRAMLNPPRVGDRVEFDVVTSPKVCKVGGNLRYT